MISVEQAKKYCYEDISLIENYESAMNDNTQTWDCHHRVETIMNCSAEELIAQGCYENRPAHDLIFLTRAEHNKLHNTGKKHSDKTRAKMSPSRIGKNNPMFGKKHSEETRTKISASLKGRKFSAETRAKMSEANSGENNPMFGRHHSEETLEKLRAAMNRPETRAKLSASLKGRKLSAETCAKLSAARVGKHFWNNGIENKFCKECPGEGWVQGRL